MPEFCGRDVDIEKQSDKTVITDKETKNKITFLKIDWSKLIEFQKAKVKK